MASPEDFQLFTSLRYDPLLLTSEENSRPDLNFVSPSPFYMLAYHRDRMVEAAQHFDFHNVERRLSDGEALHKYLQEKVDIFTKDLTPAGKDTPLKIRILFDKHGSIATDMSPIPPVPLTTLYPPSFSPPHSPPAPHPANTSTPSAPTSGALALTPGTTSHPPAAPVWALKLDTAPTPSSPFTALKTTHRAMYDASRARALPAHPAGAAFAEVLLHNGVAELTEGSLTSVYLWRGGRWVTPPVGAPASFPSSSASSASSSTASASASPDPRTDEGELRTPFAGRWGHSVRSAKVAAGGQRGTTRRWALGRGFCMEEGVEVRTVRVGEGCWVSNGVRGFGWGVVVA
ncbi:Aminodeoxychorismate lyase [Coniothyrium glycines]